MSEENLLDLTDLDPRGSSLVKLSWFGSGFEDRNPSFFLKNNCLQLSLSSPATSGIFLYTSRTIHTQIHKYIRYPKCNNNINTNNN